MHGATVQVITGGPSGGDSMYHTIVTGDADYYWGIDNRDSDAWGGPKWHRS